MTYQVLARKWRPYSLADMVGQEHILRMLGNALEKNRIHHAYLFTGTRGVGKTTLARILAKNLNCEKGITSKACNECKTCQAIDKGRFLDLFEIDAASRTKVEDTRELLDNVLYAPTEGRFKIYLIDEVHMLSNHSFNALLKTLEEPPAHVKFLLATTDPKRLPITILSRCLQFHLKRIPHELITNHLQHICETEKIVYEKEGLEKIAKSADGSMRDALSLLDQAISYGLGSVTKNDVFAMLGSTAQEDLFPLIFALCQNQGKELFDLIAKLSERAPDFYQLLEEMISIFHQVAIAQCVPTMKVEKEIISTLAKQITPKDVQLYYQIALLGRRDLMHAAYPQQGFEMTLLRMLAFKPSAESKKDKASQVKQIKNEKIKKEIPAVENKPLFAPTSDWRDLLPKLELSGMAYALASNCSLEKITENKVQLALSATHLPMLNQKLKDRIAESLSRHLNRQIELEILTTNDEIKTPVKEQQKEQQNKLDQATKTIMEDSQIKKLIEMYDATVEVSLV